MRLLLLIPLILVATSCSAPKDASTSVQPTAADPLESSYSNAPNASEWLMNQKHTLRGLSLGQAVAVLGELNEAGIIEVRAGDIQSDPADPSYKNAGTLILELSGSEGARKGAFDLLRSRNLPANDDGQKYLEVEVAVLAPQTPSP